MAKKTKRDPTQSEWIANKYARDMQDAMKAYHEGMIDIMVENSGSMETMRKKLDEYKAEAIDETFRPLAKKYVTLSAQQGGKFAKLQIKHVKT